MKYVQRGKGRHPQRPNGKKNGNGASTATVLPMKQKLRITNYLISLWGLFWIVYANYLVQTRGVGPTVTPETILFEAGQLPKSSSSHNGDGSANNNNNNNQTTTKPLATTTKKNTTRAVVAADPTSSEGSSASIDLLVQDAATANSKQAVKAPSITIGTDGSSTNHDITKGNSSFHTNSLAKLGGQNKTSSGQTKKGGKIVLYNPSYPKPEGYEIFQRDKYRYKKLDNVPVFYNLFIKDPSDYERVKKIVDEQFNKLLKIHKPIYVNSIGVPLDFNDAGIIRAGTLNTTTNPVEILGVYDQASEVVTLRHLWEYCKHPENIDQKVAYLHSKGSYTKTPENGKLRRFLTAGTLSEECATMGDGNKTTTTSCNICSSRFSPVPHPHASGNMWLARCEYIRHLQDPETFEEAMEGLGYDGGDRYMACDGRGRYAAEHWVLSHPRVKPCDLFKSKTFTWNYDGIPTVKFFRKQSGLAKFPRFDLETYLKSNTQICPFRGASLAFRIREYKSLYNETPPDDWWGYGFFQKDDVWWPYKDTTWVELPEFARQEIIKMGYNHHLWDSQHRPYALWGKSWDGLEPPHRKVLKDIFTFDEEQWNNQIRKELRDVKRVKDSVAVFEPNTSFDRCSSSKPRDEIYSWYARKNHTKTESPPANKPLREHIYETYPIKPDDTRRLLIVAAVPRDETHLLTLWTQLECFSEPVDHVMIAAPTWGRPFVEHVLRLAKQHIPHFADNTVELSVKYFLNNRYDVGLWCDAYESLTAIEKDGENGYDEYGLVNDSIFALRQFSAIFDNLQHQNIQLSSLSYSFTQKWSTGLDIDSYWVESVFRGFDRDGIDVFYEFSCLSEDDPRFCMDDVTDPDVTKACIINNFEHDLAKEYPCEKVQGLYPTEPTDLLKTSQIWKLSWIKNIRYWRMLVDHVGFPIAKANEPRMTGGWYQLSESMVAWKNDPLLKNCTKHILPRLGDLFEGLEFDRLAKPFHQQRWEDLSDGLRSLATNVLGYASSDEWDGGRDPPALTNLKKRRWDYLSKAQQEALTQFECSKVKFHKHECFKR